MNNQQGFNLVELMVALTLGTLVFLVLGQIFVSMWRTNQTQTALRDLHSGGVYGLDALEREVRRAGFAGCLGDFDEIENVATVTEGGRSVVWGKTETGSDTTYNVAGDRFRIRYLELLWHDRDRRLKQEVRSFDEADPSRIITTRRDDLGNPRLNTNDAIVISNCINADYAELSGTATRRVLTTKLPINQSPYSGSIGVTYPYRHWYIEFYVHEDDDGLLSLRRDDLGLDQTGGEIRPQPLIRDIKRMTVQYGEDTSGNSAPDVYRDASNVDMDNWDNIRALRITLDVHDPTRDLCGGITDYPPECQYQTTILLRNRL